MNLTVCPLCGHEPALPTITPELLYFRSTPQTQPKLGAVMPDGSFAVAFAGVIYSMPGAEWQHYLDMQQAAAALDERLTEAA